MRVRYETHGSLSKGECCMTVLDAVSLTDGGSISWSKSGGKTEVAAKVRIGDRCGSGRSLVGDLEEAFLTACQDAHKKLEASGINNERRA